MDSDRLSSGDLAGEQLLILRRTHVGRGLQKFVVFVQTHGCPLPCFSTQRFMLVTTQGAVLITTQPVVFITTQRVVL